MLITYLLLLLSLQNFAFHLRDLECLISSFLLTTNQHLFTLCCKKKKDVYKHAGVTGLRNSCQLRNSLSNKRSAELSLANCCNIEGPAEIRLVNYCNIEGPAQLWLVSPCSLARDRMDKNNTDRDVLISKPQLLSFAPANLRFLKHILQHL